MSGTPKPAWKVRKEPDLGRVDDATDEVAQLLANHRPSTIKPAVWADGGVGAFVRDQLLRIEGLSIEDAKRFQPILGRHAASCLKRRFPLDVEQVLDPAQVEHYITNETPDLEPNSRATYRSVLRRLGPVLTTDAPWTSSPEELGRRRQPPPYSASEVEQINRDVRRQTTERLTRSGRAIVALGLGAGLDGRENTAVHGPDVSREASGLVVVRTADRLVPVRPEYASEIATLAELAGDELLVGGTTRGKNYSSDTARKLQVGRPRIPVVGGRLRSTWIQAHLREGTPPQILLSISGIETGSGLNDHLRHLPPLSGDAVLGHFRAGVT